MQVDACAIALHSEYSPGNSCSGSSPGKSCQAQHQQQQAGAPSTRTGAAAAFGCALAHRLEQQHLVDARLDDVVATVVELGEAIPSDEISNPAVDLRINP